MPVAVGFGYTALVIDAFAGLIVGWERSLRKHTAFVESAIRQAVALRRRQGHPPAGDTIHTPTPARNTPRCTSAKPSSSKG